MRNGRRLSRQRDRGDMDMTSMVDVVFLLLIFFMVTASFQVQRSHAFDSEAEDQPSQTVVEADDEIRQIHVLVTEFGAFQLSGTEFQVEVIGKQNLIRVLFEVSSKQKTRITLRAHPESSFERCVDVIDAATTVGIQSISYRDWMHNVYDLTDEL